MTIQIFLQGQSLTAVSPRLASNSLKKVFCSITPDSEWANLSTTLVFRCVHEHGEACRSVLVHNFACIEVPHEVLQEGWLYIGATGVAENGSVRLTTAQMAQPLHVHPSENPYAPESDAVTPSLGEQIIASIGILSNLATNAKDNLVDSINELAETFVDNDHNHSTHDITGLDTMLTNKADRVHTHEQSDIIGLSSALMEKAPTKLNFIDVTDRFQALIQAFPDMMQDVSAEAYLKGMFDGAYYIHDGSDGYYARTISGGIIADDANYDELGPHDSFKNQIIWHVNKDGSGDITYFINLVPVAKLQIGIDTDENGIWRPNACKLIVGGKEIAIKQEIESILTELNRELLIQKGQIEEVSELLADHPHRVEDITDFPETMPPIAHYHPASDIVGLPELSAQLPVKRCERFENNTFYISEDDLPPYQNIAAGFQMIFICDLSSYTGHNGAVSLKIGSGNLPAARSISQRLKGSSSVPAGSLGRNTILRGVPYTLTYAGNYWLLDDFVANHEHKELTVKDGMTLLDESGDGIIIAAVASSYNSENHPIPGEIYLQDTVDDAIPVRISGVADPVNDLDVANKKYVDDLFNSIENVNEVSF